MAQRTKKRREDLEHSLAGLVTKESEDNETPTLETTMDFLLTLGRSLLVGGLPAHRIEYAVESVAKARSFTAQVFSTPTALTVSLSDGDAELTRLCRVSAGATNLERLAALHVLVKRVIAKELTPQEAAERIRAIEERKPRYGRLFSFFAHVVSAAAGAVLLRGSLYDVLAAAIVAVPVYLLLFAGSLHRPLQGLIPVLAAATVAGIIAILVNLGMPVRAHVVLLAGLFVLLPGYRITAAATELATGNVVSGTARTVSAFAIFLQLGFGAAIGYQLGFPSESSVVAERLPWFAVYAGTLVTALALSAKLQVRPKDLPYVVLVCLLAIVGAELTKPLGAEIAAFTGAVVVGLSSHILARLRDQSVLVMLTPGIFLLVPGSVGFLSVSKMLENDVIGGVESAFRMLLVVMAIVAGILVAGAALPPKRAL